VGRLGAGRAGDRTGIYAADEGFSAEGPRRGTADGTLALVSTGSGGVGRFTAAAVVGETAGMDWEVDAENRLVLHVPGGTGEATVGVLRYEGRGLRALSAFAQWAAAQRTAAVPDPEVLDSEMLDSEMLDPEVLDPEVLAQGGPRRWAGAVTTEIQRDVGRAHYDPVYYQDADRDQPGKLVPIPPDYPYAVDEIALPFANPWDAWMRPTALDFFDDGRLVLATYPGDIWVASGLDGGTASWQRVATGLYEPMGVRVVDGTIYVTARDRLVRLHDRNGDGEADFYESFYADQDVSDFFHAFAFGLQTDSRGNFYYTKAGQYTNNAHPGDVMRISPDGRRGETVAMGFRTPNGITVSPDDRVFVSDNQGSWMPANKISLIRPGGYYGYVPNLATRHWSPDGISVDEQGHSPLLDQVAVPDTFDQPVVWMPQELDNSPGGGTWSADGWGPLGGRFIHTSFGKGWVYLVMLQEVEGVTQGAVVPLPFQFDAGLQRARVNPADGQIYVVGLTGWDDGFATRYGSLNRIRYTGGEGHLLTDVKVRPDGVALTFNTALGAAAARPEAYEVLQWNYKWQRRYGSDDWSLARPGEQGRDTVAVAAVRLSDDGRTATVKIPGLRPVDQMRIRFDVQAADGARIRETVYLTVRR
jgi:hypothetical protein